MRAPRERETLERSSIANSIGGHEPLALDPVNAWAATLILAAALDLSRAGGVPGRGGN